MIAEADNIQEPNREMPGQMPVEQDVLLGADHPPATNEQVDEDLDDSEEEEEEEEVSVSNVYGSVAFAYWFITRSLCR
jgi:hypothetical protein